jgi:DNA-binding CsgD family transcriptional regulator
LEFGVDFSKKINPIISDCVKKNLISVNNKLVQPVFPQEHIDKKDFNLSACSNVSDQIHNHSLFTLRQIECIYCIAHGLTSAQTSTVLNISKRTVESILNTAMLNAGCTNRYQLIYQSTKYGLIVDDMISPLIKLKIEQELHYNL